MTKIEPPCRRCEKRYIGCHARCVKYTAYRLYIEHRNEEIRKINDEESFYVDISRYYKRKLRQIDKMNKGRK